MEKSMMYLGIIIVVVIVVAGVYFMRGGSGTKDCGTDTACFEEAMQSCTKAKVTTSETAAGMTASADMKVLGKSGSDCKVYMKVIEMPIFDSFEGKSMTCEVPMSLLSGGVSAWDVIDVSSDDIDCSGSLVDAVEDMASGFGL